MTVLRIPLLKSLGCCLLITAGILTANNLYFAASR